jgi:hypothetical protein
VKAAPKRRTFDVRFSVNSGPSATSGRSNLREDAAKRVLQKADQALGVLADQIRAHRRIASRLPCVHRHHPPPLASASSESELYLIRATDDQSPERRTTDIRIVRKPAAAAAYSQATES